LQCSIALISQLELPRDPGVGAPFHWSGVVDLQWIVEFRVMVLQQVLAGKQWEEGSGAPEDGSAHRQGCFSSVRGHTCPRRQTNAHDIPILPVPEAGKHLIFSILDALYPPGIPVLSLS
jgi:hypothetical protein